MAEPEQDLSELETPAPAETETPATDEPDEGEPSVEEKARLQGWVSEDEWRGPKNKWVSADQFVERGEQNHRITKERLTAMERELASTRQTLAAMERTNAAMADRAYQQAMADLKAARNQAARNFDNENAFKYQEQIDELKQQQQSQPPPPAQIDPETQAWFDGADEQGIPRQAWYNKDPILTAEMNSMMGILWQQYPQANQGQRLALAEEAVKRRYPNQFQAGNPMRQQPAGRGGNGGSSAPRKGGKKSYADLPPEARKACDLFVKDKRYGLTREQYVEEYFANA